MTLLDLCGEGGYSLSHITPGPKTHKHGQSRRERQRRQSEGGTASQEGECKAGL